MLSFFSSTETEPKTLPSVHKDDLIIDRLLNKGSFGEVYLGLFKNEPVAIKKIIRKNHDKKENEICLHASLSHPHIVSALARYDSPDRDIYLVLELINGQDLFACIVHDEQKTMLSLSTRISIAKNIIDALTYLHETMGILHCDIKPENILLNHHMEAKLCDFGLSATIEDASKLSPRGSRAYYAPELYYRNAHNTKNTDIYALGITFFVLITATNPNTRHTINIVYQMMNQVSNTPLDIAKAFKNLVINSAAEKPSDRMSLADMSKLIKAIAELANTTPSSVPTDLYSYSSSIPTNIIEVSEEQEDKCNYSCTVS